jgi:hypothetical protein
VNPGCAAGVCWCPAGCGSSVSIAHEKDSAATCQGDPSGAQQSWLCSNPHFEAAHHFLKHPDGRKTVVPVHSGETIGPGLLLKIPQACELNLEELDRLRS